MNLVEEPFHLLDAGRCFKQAKIGEYSVFRVLLNV